MAYTYSNWITVTDTPGRITRLRLHIQEASELIGREVSADGKSVGSQSTLGYVKHLQEQLRDLESRPDATGAIAGGTSLASFNGNENV